MGVNISHISAGSAGFSSGNSVNQSLADRILGQLSPSRSGHSLAMEKVLLAGFLDSVDRDIAQPRPSRSGARLRAAKSLRDAMQKFAKKDTAGSRRGVAKSLGELRNEIENEQKTHWASRVSAGVDPTVEEVEKLNKLLSGGVFGDAFGDSSRADVGEGTAADGEIGGWDPAEQPRMTEEQLTAEQLRMAEEQSAEAKGKMMEQTYVLDQQAAGMAAIFGLFDEHAGLTSPEIGEELANMQQQIDQEKAAAGMSSGRMDPSPSRATPSSMYAIPTASAAAPGKSPLSPVDLRLKILRKQQAAQQQRNVMAGLGVQKMAIDVVENKIRIMWQIKPQKTDADRAEVRVMMQKLMGMKAECRAYCEKNEIPSPYAEGEILRRVI